MASTAALPRLPIFVALAKHDSDSTVAVHSVSQRQFKYGQLLQDVAAASTNLRREFSHVKHDHPKTCIEGQRIAFLVENSYDYVVTLLSIFAVQAIALPLSPAFPVHELQYIMEQSEASILLTSTKFECKAQEIMQKVGTTPRLAILAKLDSTSNPTMVKLEGLQRPDHGDGGMMLYTSGTTSRPKGVHLPLATLTAQATSLVEAWKYASQDRLLHVLPLHHIHGTVNAIIAPLFAGSSIEFLFPFNASAVWHRFASPFLNEGSAKSPVTFFTAVPTVYSRLLDTIRDHPQDLQSAARKAISPDNLRLNISGSAALPTPIKKAWSDLSGGNILLERYGMTEVGMALSCGLNNADRVDASVGWPLPAVEVRLVDTETGEVIQAGEELGKDGKERDGEIQLRGPTVFKQYWRNDKATKEEFEAADDGKGLWFKTGDVAVRRVVSDVGKSGEDWTRGPMYFIRGRKSADIIKTGGEKVSALEVERELLSLPQIAQAAVVAVPSGKWGQKVGAILVMAPDQKGAKGKQWGPMDMRRALRDKMANYKIPQVMKVVDDIPRNAMGKINKKELVKAVFVEEASGDEM